MTNNFRKYDHLERYGHNEVEGLDVGTVYVFPKLDGTNASAWCHEGQVYGGSRNRCLSLEADNQGFLAWLLSDDQKGLQEFLQRHDDLVVYGEWMCLSGDTEIRLLSGGKRGHYVTLREMYEYSVSPVEENLSYKTKNGIKHYKYTRKPWWERNGYPQIFSWFEDEDIIKPQKIAKIIYSGEKEVYKITTRKGKTIKSTKDHKFLTNSGWKRLEEISVGDVVATTELFNARPPRRLGKGTKKIQELHQDLKVSKNCESCGSGFALEIHHIDHNWKNNEKENLRVLCRDCHTKSHKNISYRDQIYNYEFDKVINIEYVGIEDCYDISMGTNENSSSFVANNFIVHNCPHTLKTYRQEVWRRFWVFDVWSHTKERYLSWDEYNVVLAEAGFDLIQPLCKITNPSQDQMQEMLAQNTFLIADGAGVGEGLVFKNYQWVNQYGRQPWMKLVVNAFKEQNAKVFGITEKVGERIVEADIVDKYVTPHLVGKTRAKVVIEVANEKGIDISEPNAQAKVESGFRSKVIPQLLSRVFHDLITEEMWSILKDFKNPTIDFGKLNKYTTLKIKSLAQDLF